MASDKLPSYPLPVFGCDRCENPAVTEVEGFFFFLNVSRRKVHEWQKAHRQEAASCVILLGLGDFFRVRVPYYARFAFSLSYIASVIYCNLSVYVFLRNENIPSFHPSFHLSPS